MPVIVGTTSTRRRDTAHSYERRIKRREKRGEAEAADVSSLALFRSKVWALVDDPSSSKAAQLMAAVIMVLIVVSVASFCLETLPQFHRKNEDVWYGIETVCIVLFTLEYVARLLTCPQLWPFLKAPLNIVDLVAIVPFYLELLIDDAESSGSAVFRVVRLVRVFRVFKISRYLSWVKMFANAMAQSAQPLGMLVFIMGIGCVFFSSAMYYAERGTWDEATETYIRDDGTPSPYYSIPAAFWWCIITMTTVGYGDDVPITFAGKSIAVVTSLCGILVLAIPITVISTNFNQEFETMKRDKEMTRRRLVLLKNQFRLKRRGLPALQDELEDLITSTTTDYRDQVSEIVDQTRTELSTEIDALVRIAYETREQLHAEFAAAKEKAERQGGAGGSRVGENSVESGDVDSDDEEAARHLSRGGLVGGPRGNLGPNGTRGPGPGKQFTTGSALIPLVTQPRASQPHAVTPKRPRDADPGGARKPRVSLTTALNATPHGQEVTTPAAGRGVAGHAAPAEPGRGESARWGQLSVGRQSASGSGKESTASRRGEVGRPQAGHLQSGHLHSKHLPGPLSRTASTLPPQDQGNSFGAPAQVFATVDSDASSSTDDEHAAGEPGPGAKSPAGTGADAGGAAVTVPVGEHAGTGPPAHATRSLPASDRDGGQHTSRGTRLPPLPAHAAGPGQTSHGVGGLFPDAAERPPRGVLRRDESKDGEMDDSGPGEAKTSGRSRDRVQPYVARHTDDEGDIPGDCSSADGEGKDAREPLE